MNGACNSTFFALPPGALCHGVLVVKIVANLSIYQKTVFCLNYSETNSLLDVYNIFSFGKIDKAAPITQLAMFSASAGRPRGEGTYFALLAQVSVVHTVVMPYSFHSNISIPVSNETGLKLLLECIFTLYLN